MRSNYRDNRQSFSKVKYDSKELIPCDFLRYVANVGDDLDELAFQLHANHADNFPEEAVTKQQEKQHIHESFGQKVFKLLFKPTPVNLESQAQQRRKTLHAKQKLKDMSMDRGAMQRNKSGSDLMSLSVDNNS